MNQNKEHKKQGNFGYSEFKEIAGELEKIIKSDHPTSVCKVFSCEDDQTYLGLASKLRYGKFLKAFEQIKEYKIKANNII